MAPDMQWSCGLGPPAVRRRVIVSGNETALTVGRHHSVSTTTAIFAWIARICLEQAGYEVRFTNQLLPTTAPVLGPLPANATMVTAHAWSTSSVTPSCDGIQAPVRPSAGDKIAALDMLGSSGPGAETAWYSNMRLSSDAASDSPVSLSPDVLSMSSTALEALSPSPGFDSLTGRARVLQQLWTRVGTQASIAHLADVGVNVTFDGFGGMGATRCRASSTHCGEAIAPLVGTWGQLAPVNASVTDAPNSDDSSVAQMWQLPALGRDIGSGGMGMNVSTAWVGLGSAAQAQYNAAGVLVSSYGTYASLVLARLRAGNHTLFAARSPSLLLSAARAAASTKAAANVSHVDRLEPRVGCRYGRAFGKKWAWRGLASTAPAARDVLLQLSLSDNDVHTALRALAKDIDDSVREPVTSSSRDETIRRVACDLLNGKFSVNSTVHSQWRAWLPPPPLCDATHIVYSVGSCNTDVEDSRRLLSFSWRNVNLSSTELLADDCIGGVRLPPEALLPCTFVSAKEGGVIALLVLSITALVLSTVVVAVAASRRAHPCFHHVAGDRFGSARARGLAVASWTPSLLVFIGLGCGVSISSLFTVVSVDETFVGCNRRRVPLGLGLIFLMSAYILKAKKVIQIAHGRGLFRGPSRGGSLIQLLFGVGTRQVDVVNTSKNVGSGPSPKAPRSNRVQPLSPEQVVSQQHQGAPKHTHLKGASRTEASGSSRRMSRISQEMELIQSRKRVHDKIRGLSVLKESYPLASSNAKLAAQNEQAIEPPKLALSDQDAHSATSWSHRSPLKRDTKRATDVMLVPDVSGAGPMLVSLSPIDARQRAWEMRTNIAFAIRLLVIEAILLALARAEEQLRERRVAVLLDSPVPSRSMTVKYNEKICGEVNPIFEIILWSYNAILTVYTLLLHIFALRTRVIAGSRDIHAVYTLGICGLVVAAHGLFGMRSMGASSSAVLELNVSTHLSRQHIGSSHEVEDYVVMAIATLVSVASVLHSSALPRMYELICRDYGTVDGRPLLPRSVFRAAERARASIQHVSIVIWLSLTSRFSTVCCCRTRFALLDGEPRGISDARRRSSGREGAQERRRTRSLWPWHRPSATLKTQLMQERLLRELAASDFLIPNDELQVLSPLGANSMVEVFKGKFKYANVAIKRLGRNVSEAYMRAFGQEVIKMAELRHPNVVLMMGFTVNPPALVMEFLARGSLFRILHIQRPTFDLHWTMVLRMLVDIAGGIGFLHAQEPAIVHSNLKTPNILVDMSWRCKVADLGLGKLKQELQRAGHPLGQNLPVHERRGSGSFGVGSPLWCAPEVFTQQRLTSASDVYAFGIMLFEMLFRTLPYTTPHIAQIALPLKVVAGTRPSASPGCVMQVQSELGTGTCGQLIALMEACWHEEPRSRPPFKHILPQLEMIAAAFTGDDLWESRVVFPRGGERVSGVHASAEHLGAEATRQERGQSPFAVGNDLTVTNGKSKDVHRASDEIAEATLLAALADTEVDFASNSSNCEWVLDATALHVADKLPSAQSVAFAVHDGSYRGEPVAVQPLFLSHVRCSVQSMKAFIHATRTLCHQPHPNLLPTVGIAWLPPRLMMVTARAADLGNSLWETYHAQAKAQPLQTHWLMALGLAIDVSSAMSHLHALGLTHGHLRSRAICITGEGDALVGDLAMHELQVDDPHCVLGDPRWYAPEVLRADVGSTAVKADVYAFAMILYELFYWCEPFLQPVVEHGNITPKHNNALMRSTPQLVAAKDVLQPSAEQADEHVQPSFFKRLSKGLTPPQGSRRMQGQYNGVETQAETLSPRHLTAPSLELPMNSPRTVDTNEVRGRSVSDGAPAANPSDQIDVTVPMEESKPQNVYNIVSGVVSSGKRPMLFEGSAPDEVHEALQLCWSEDPKARPDFETMMRSFEALMVEFETEPEGEAEVEAGDVGTRSHRRRYSRNLASISTSIRESFKRMDSFKRNRGHLSVPEKVDHDRPPQKSWRSRARPPPVTTVDRTATATGLGLSSGRGITKAASRQSGVSAPNSAHSIVSSTPLFSAPIDE